MPAARARISLRTSAASSIVRYASDMFASAPPADSTLIPAKPKIRPRIGCVISTAWMRVRRATRSLRNRIPERSTTASLVIAYDVRRQAK
jgi:hypothetical protein